MTPTLLHRPLYVERSVGVPLVCKTDLWLGCRRMCADFPLAAADTLLCVLWQLDILDCDILCVRERV